METISKISGLSLVVLLMFFSVEVQGQKRGRDGNKTVRNERSHRNDHVRTDRYRTQPVYRNPSYRYPHRHRVVRTLPRHHVRIVYRGLPYFYYSGIYYTLYGDQYIVVLPPRGFRIHTLPVGCVRVYVGPTVYYYYSGVYYLESPTPSTEDEGKYEVTQPPVGLVLDEISEESKEVVIDGSILYEYNDVLYKKIVDSEGKESYKVVYSKSKED